MPNFPRPFGQVYARDLVDIELYSPGGQSDGFPTGYTHAYDTELAPRVDPLLARTMDAPGERARRWKTRNQYPTTRMGMALWGIRRLLEDAEPAADILEGSSGW